MLTDWQVGLTNPKVTDDQLVVVNQVDMTHLRPGVGVVDIDNVRNPIDEHTIRAEYPLTEKQQIALVTDPVLVMHDPKA